MTKLDPVVEKLIREARNKLEKRNLSLQNSVEDFKKELPKHESFPNLRICLLPILEYMKMKLFPIEISWRCWKRLMIFC